MTRAKAAEIYRDWVNNFLTMERFASYYDLSLPDAQRLVNVGRIAHEKGF
jgi:hypothetical protein